MLIWHRESIDLAMQLSELEITAEKRIICIYLFLSFFLSFFRFHLHRLFALDLLILSPTHSKKMSIAKKFSFYKKKNFLKHSSWSSNFTRTFCLSWQSQYEWKPLKRKNGNKNGSFQELILFLFFPAKKDNWLLKTYFVEIWTEMVFSSRRWILLDVDSILMNVVVFIRHLNYFNILHQKIWAEKCQFSCKYKNRQFRE